MNLQAFNANVPVKIFESQKELDSEWPKDAGDERKGYAKQQIEQKGYTCLAKFGETYLLVDLPQDVGHKIIGDLLKVVCPQCGCNTGFELKEYNFILKEEVTQISSKGTPGQLECKNQEIFTINSYLICNECRAVFIPKVENDRLKPGDLIADSSETDYHLVANVDYFLREAENPGDTEPRMEVDSSDTVVYNSNHSNDEYNCDSDEEVDEEDSEEESEEDSSGEVSVY